MPRGHKQMSYAEAQARCRAIFQGCPEIEPDVVEAVFKAHYHGWTMTRSEIAEARRWVLEQPKAIVRDKDRYLVAWLSLHPDLPLTTLDAFTLLYFGETTRQETFDRCRQAAQSGSPMLPEAARGVILEIERRVVEKQKGFDLE